MARKILLADDSVTAQNMGRKILADAGYEVVTVNNGSAALKKIAELKPDLVILDVYMPGYSGLEVCQRLKESQDSSRIPVLLTVGKLEPFKPEEAQRVRAEGFIVKPFEASELLSALSKLEDKVVPRAEPSKPGRFARAIAAQEEVSRSNQATGEDGGWKSRIAFPHQKTEAEEKVADESAIYNPINRDLRTVVETPAEKKEEQKHRTENVRETNVDVAALAPEGLPRDVTPEEIAAITAAAAQINALKEAQQNVEASNQANEQPVAAGKDELPTKEEQPSLVSAEAKEPIQKPAEAKSARSEEEESEDAPMTMAAAFTSSASMAANQSVSRWTAVAVALEAEDAGISLDQEMQKAYAAFVAQETASATMPMPSGIATSETPVEAPSATISDPQIAGESAPAVIVEAAQTAPKPATEPELPAAVSPVSIEPTSPPPAEAVSSPAATDVVPTEAHASEAAVVAPTDDGMPREMSAPQSAEVQAPAEVGNETAAQTVASIPEPEKTPEPVTEAVSASSEASGNSFAPIVQAEEPKIEEQKVEHPKEDSDVVKNTAAAWASWRQIRDSGDAHPGEPSKQESEPPAPAAEESSVMAAAAGAEQLLHDATASPETPTDVASIVDSVLADLRPKLMAEITRKMSEKK